MSHLRPFRAAGSQPKEQATSYINGWPVSAVRMGSVNGRDWVLAAAAPAVSIGQQQSSDAFYKRTMTAAGLCYSSSGCRSQRFWYMPGAR